MSSFVIDSQNSGAWFTAIYAFVIVMANTMFIVQGVKQRSSLTTVWLIATTGTLLMFAGIHVFPLSGDELKEFILIGNVSTKGAKSVLGSLLGFAGIIIASLWLKERISLVDNMVVPFMIGIGLQNIGCLAAGCCYGTATNFPLNVQYGDHSRAYIDGLTSGIIEPHIHTTSTLHPTQLYFLIGCFLIAFILFKYKKHLTSPMSSFFAAWALYSMLRFFIEFARDPMSNHGLGYMIYSLKAIQWFLLAAGIGFTLFFLAIQHFYKPRNKHAKHKAGNWRYVFLVILMVLLSWKIRPLIDPVSNLLVIIFLFTSIALVAWKLIQDYTLPKYRFATVSLVLVSLVFMGQKYIPDSETKNVTFTELGAGIQFSKFFTEIGTSARGTGCDGNPYYFKENSKKESHNTILGGIHYSQITSYNKYDRSSYGIDGFVGFSSGEMTNNTIIGLRPNLSYSSRWLGMSLGVNLGQFHMAGIDIDPEVENLGEVVGHSKTLYILPSGSFFIGPFDIAYFKISYADRFPSAFPTSLYSYSIGSGLGKTDGRFVEFGQTYLGYELLLSMPINVDTYLGATLRFMSSKQYLDNRSNFSFGIRYRLNYKTYPKISTNIEPEAEPTSY